MPNPGTCYVRPDRWVWVDPCIVNECAVSTYLKDYFREQRYRIKMYGLGYVSVFNKLKHNFGGAISALVCALQITECR